MRALGFLGLAGAIALVPAGSPVAADSGRPAATMTMNAPAPAARGGWGGVPNAPLNPPAPQPGWGAGGYHGGVPGGPMAGGPGPGGPRPGGPGPGGMGPGGPGMMHPGGPGRPGGWHGGGGNWHGQYQHVGRGHRLPRFWLSPDYYLSDWGRYGLWNPGYGQNWIRYYDDALLIDGSGRVIDGRYGVDWDGGGYDPGYGDGDDDYGYGGGGYHHGYHHGGGDYRQGGVTIHRGPGTTVVVVQGQPSVTTTTTTTYETVGSYPHKRKWHKRTWKPACRCR